MGERICSNITEIMLAKCSGSGKESALTGSSKEKTSCREEGEKGTSNYQQREFAADF